MTLDKTAILFAISVAVTGCMTDAADGTSGAALGETAQAMDEAFDDGGAGTSGGGGSYPEPTLALDGSSGLYISVGWLGGGRINRGTFDGLTIPQTVDTLSTTWGNRPVTLVEYCTTLAMIINNNWCRAGSLEQAAMATAWGTNCSPLGSGGGSC